MIRMSRNAGIDSCSHGAALLEQTLEVVSVVLVHTREANLADTSHIRTVPVSRVKPSV